MYIVKYKTRKRAVAMYFILLTISMGLLILSAVVLIHALQDFNKLMVFMGMFYLVLAVFGMYQGANSMKILEINYDNKILCISTLWFFKVTLPFDDLIGVRRFVVNSKFRSHQALLIKLSSSKELILIDFQISNLQELSKRLLSILPVKGRLLKRNPWRINNAELAWLVLGVTLLVFVGTALMQI